MQYCCSQLRTKEMLDGAKDDLWWKPNFAQRHSASWNMVQHGGQTSPTLVSVGSSTMLRDVASVWPGIKDTNGGSENKNCSVCTLATYNAELILWSIIFILKFCWNLFSGAFLNLTMKRTYKLTVVFVADSVLTWYVMLIQHSFLIFIS